MAADPADEKVAAKSLKEQRLEEKAKARSSSSQMENPAHGEQH